MIAAGVFGLRVYWLQQDVVPVGTEKLDMMSTTACCTALRTGSESTHRMRKEDKSTMRFVSNVESKKMRATSPNPDPNPTGLGL